MKKILLSAFIIITFVAYTLHKRFGVGEETTAVVAPNHLLQEASSQNLNSPDPSPINSPSAKPQNSPASSPTSKPNGLYKDGSYTGDVADAYYGNIQVQVTVSGGKIVDVVFLQYPNDRRHSVEINSQAMPYLKQEAIAAQSANVDIISGATQSSLAFRQSMQSALIKAKN